MGRALPCFSNFDRAFHVLSRELDPRPGRGFDRRQEIQQNVWIGARDQFERLANAANLDVPPGRGPLWNRCNGSSEARIAIGGPYTKPSGPPRTLAAGAPG